jgi:hypothetical protein
MMKGILELEAVLRGIDLRILVIVVCCVIVKVVSLIFPEEDNFYNDHRPKRVHRRKPPRK